MKLARSLLPHALLLLALGWLICESSAHGPGEANLVENHREVSHETHPEVFVPTSKENVGKATDKDDDDKDKKGSEPTKGIRGGLDEYGNPPQAVFFGSLGGSIAMAMSAVGSAIGIAKAGVSATHLGLAEPSRMLRGMLPVVMSELLSIYGLIVGVVISLSVGNSSKGYTMNAGFMHLAAGSCVGLCGLGAGFAIGSVGDACCRAYQRTPHIFTAMVLMLVFAEAIGLYGLIGALVLHGNAGK